MDPSVSVIIPSFNHEAYIDEAVESVLTSSVDDVELIIIDDGSTDDSRRILEAYRDDPRVNLHFQKNCGAHAALNRGLEIARGETAFILDSDDAFSPDRIPVLAEKLKANSDAALAASWIRVIDAQGAEIGVKEAWRSMPPWPAPKPGPLLSDLGDPRLALLETNWISTTSNLAFPLSLVREHGLRFAPLRYAHDWDFILAACAFGPVELIEKPLLRYRVHGANTIDDGADDDRGRMRFEIMWVVARHARRLLSRTTAPDRRPAEFGALLARSAPTFGHHSIFDQLLVLRGDGETSSAAYDALLDPAHRFTRAAVDALQNSTH